MGVQSGTEKVPIARVSVPSFSGGMNTSVKRRDIADNELVSIQNLEFDDSSDLVTRNGWTTDGTGRSSVISSIFVFNTETAFIGILYTFSNSLISRPLVLGAETDLSAGLPGGIPNNTRWYWKQLGNTAVAVNGGPTVKVVGGAPGTASALAAAPNGKYIEEWRNRLFIVHAANPNRIQCSDLGSALNWNTGGLTNPAQGITFDVAPGDGDVITALFAFKERLFIFKRKKIYVLRATALPETDPNSWEVVEYSKIIGCVNQTTVREVFDDVAFLSEAGLCSLAASEMTADFSSALISQKIETIQRLSQNATELDIFGFTLVDKSQYWLSLQTGAGDQAGQGTYVVDYKKIREGIPLRWVRFNGLVPTAMDAYNVAQTKITYVWGANRGGSNNRIGKYVANLTPAARTYKDVDNGSNITILSSISTKTYDLGYSDLRKLFRWWILGIEHPATTDIDLAVSYQIYPLAIGTFASYPTIHSDSSITYDALRSIRRALLWGFPRKGWGIDFGFSVNTMDQGMIIRHFVLSAALLSDPVTEDDIIH